MSAAVKDRMSQLGRSQSCDIAREHASPGSILTTRGNVRIAAAEFLPASAPQSREAAR